MAFKRMLPQRLFRISRLTCSAVTNCRVSSPCASGKTGTLNNPTAQNNLAPDPGDDGVFSRYLHNQSAAAVTPELRFISTGEKLLEKLREMNIAKQRILLEHLRPPPVMEVEEKESLPKGTMTVKDAVKILRLSLIESVRSRLRQIEKDWISYPEFLEICAKDCSSIDQGLEFAKTLDQSGSVIVLGNIVFLKPAQEIETMFRTQIS